MSRDGYESNAKRRLSLRGGAGSPEKKPRNDSEMSKDIDRMPNPERLSDYVEARTAQYPNNAMDIDSTSNRLPTSATSSRFPQSTSAQSSAPGSPEDRQARRSLSRDRLSAPLSTQPRMMAPKWATSAPNEPEQMAYSSSSSRSSNRPQIPPQFSTSAPSQIPSPPSYNLSNGQPLVNPPLKTQAAFVGKLYAMLEDEDIARTGLIQWSPDGSVFTCPNPTEFAKIVLPRFFKHNNWQSFVRQLNMYSFNKVNDLFATSTDPQAWEFRHHLFRRGEPQLLAQIKRKSARPNQAESSGIATSPTDDPNERIAGWMRPDKPFSVPSPPKERVFGYNMQTGETVLPRSGDGLRPTSRGYWDSRQHGPPASSHGMDASYSRLHPTSRPAERYGMPSQYADVPYPAAPGGSIETSHRVAALEEHIQRLTATLNEERVDNARNHLQATSSMLQMLNWVSRSHAPDPSDVRVMRDALNRQTYDLQQHYETLMASDVLANLAVPRPGSRDDRPRMSERTLSAQHRDRPTGFPDVRQPSRSGQGTSPRPGYVPQEPSRPLSLSQLNEGIAQHPLTSSASYSTSPFDHISQRGREMHRRQTDGATRPVDTAEDRDRNRDIDKDKDEPMEETRGPSGLRNLLN